MSWYGGHGTRLNMLPETGVAGRSALQPYEPRGPKGIGVVSKGKTTLLENCFIKSMAFQSEQNLSGRQRKVQLE